MSNVILTVPFPFVPLSPDSVGGAEQIASLLDRAIHAAGLRSLVVAPASSLVSGELIPIPDPPQQLNLQSRAQVHLTLRQSLHHILETRTVDLIHFHGLDFHAYLPHSGPRALATLHLPLTFYPDSALLPTPNLTLNCVSRSQAATRAWDPPVIPNGICVNQFRFTPDKQRYTLALGRICPEKGFHHALDAAKLADIDLILAGQVFPYADHQRYFAGQIQPRLDARRRFFGPASLREKRDLLARASCLLITSEVAETSSLVAMEALASGTPVIAFRVGALPEIIDHGRTGFLVDDVASMADAIARVSTLSPYQCRADAEARFDAKFMTASYLRLYQRILTNPAASETCAETQTAPHLSPR